MRRSKLVATTTLVVQLILGWASFATAQTAGPQPMAVQQVNSSLSVPAPPATQPLATAVIVPALTPVVIQVDKALGSKISKPDDRFPITLHQPIVVDGKELVPAGAQGEGEVVDAKPAGMSGSSGRLILAARFLAIDGRQLRLRSLHLALSGKNRIATATTMGVVGAAVPGVGLIGLFVSGNNVDVPAGSIAEAKTAVDFTLDGAVPPPSIPSPSERKTP